VYGAAWRINREYLPGPETAAADAQPPAGIAGTPMKDRP